MHQDERKNGKRATETFSLNQNKRYIWNVLWGVDVTRYGEEKKRGKG
jgi:hypothetical protein